MDYCDYCQKEVETWFDRSYTYQTMDGESVEVEKESMCFRCCECGNVIGD